MSENIRVLIVDDLPETRENVRKLLQFEPDVEVIGQAGTGEQAIEMAKTHEPDIILMDINMPIIDGVETTTQALKLYPELKIIALTLFSDTLHYSQMINAGAKGFVLKKAKKFELQQAITEVFNGGNYFSQDILKQLAFNSINLTDNLNKLTNREIDVLSLVCNGKTSQEIADKLFISLKTVETHRTNIFSKTNVRNAAELIIWAVKNNYFTIE